jgi:hypothetical protein
MKKPIGARILPVKATARNVFIGFDHGAGHPLLYLDDVRAPNCRKNNEFKNLGNYSEWLKVAGAVINACSSTRRERVQQPIPVVVAF